MRAYLSRKYESIMFSYFRLYRSLFKSYILEYFMQTTSTPTFD